jgi:hypothetical protein
MSKNLLEAREALFNYFVDLLVDLSDPEDDERDIAYDDMVQVVTILFEGLDLEVVSEKDGVLQVQIAL